MTDVIWQQRFVDEHICDMKISITTFSEWSQEEIMAMEKWVFQI